MARNKNNKKRKRAAVSSSSDSDSSGSETDKSAPGSIHDSDDDTDRDISGQKTSDDDGEEDESGEESEVDIRDQFLPIAFQPKPVKCVVSEWAKRKLRGPFLGTVLSKDERHQLFEDYISALQKIGNFSLLQKFQVMK